MLKPKHYILLFEPDFRTVSHFLKGIEFFVKIFRGLGFKVSLATNNTAENIEALSKIENFLIYPTFNKNVK